MFKAIHAITGKELIILNPFWLRRVPELRKMDQADLLVCQGCRQPVRVKAGEVKRPHFAHKHLKACSYGSESPEILAARAVLYAWLHFQFGDTVSVEKYIEGRGLPRPVDCWVETSAGPVAYWIIENGIRLEQRETIRRTLPEIAANVRYLFLSSILNEEKKEYHSLLLTPTERAFIQSTPFDEMLAGAGDVGGSLHYLDTQNEELITFRNLVLFHKPNWYKGHKKTARISEVRAGRKDGAFIYPGERDRLDAFYQKRSRLEQKRRAYEQRAAEYAARHPFSAPKPWSPRERLPRQIGQETPEALPCAICGQVTSDYWSTFFDEQGIKRCRCRACLEAAGG